MDSFFGKVITATLWIWLPFYALILLLKEIADRRAKQ
jgi:hypothetical protein